MARRPSSDLDDLTVPKTEEAAPAAPQAALVSAAAHGTKMKAYAHTLSLRLTSEQYVRLRGYVIDQETKTGQRFSHQSIIEAALVEWLDRNGG